MNNTNSNSNNNLNSNKNENANNDSNSNKNENSNNESNSKNENANNSTKNSGNNKNGQLEEVPKEKNPTWVCLLLSLFVLMPISVLWIITRSSESGYKTLRIVGILASLIGLIVSGVSCYTIDSTNRYIISGGAALLLPLALFGVYFITSTLIVGFHNT